MSDARTKISEYVDELISVPRAHVRMEMRQDEKGLSLMHDGRALVECPLTREGMMSAGFMAQALGAKIPPLGESTPVRASTGLLFRAVSIAALDYTKEESTALLERLLEEAGEQRGASSDAV
jgi:hypothetical protein